MLKTESQVRLPIRLTGTCCYHLRLRN